MSQHKYVFDYDTRIDFANIRQAKVLKLQELKRKAVEAFRQRYAEDAESIALGFALKLSISGSNVDRMVPMEIRGHNVSSETFRSCVQPQRGQAADAETLTVSRFCASMADDIGSYLEVHPSQVRTVVEGVPSKYSFPHNYYMSDLTLVERGACIEWLQVHDEVMRKATGGTWRSLAEKATAYFAANPLMEDLAE